jgi:hypothetical protein
VGTKGKGVGKQFEKKHSVLVYLGKDGNTDAQYKGEREFEIKLSTDLTKEIILPCWFDTKNEALEFIRLTKGHAYREFQMIEEITFPGNKEHEKKAEAGIIGSIKCSNYPVSSNTVRDILFYGKMVKANVRIMWLCDYRAAQHYVDFFNSRIETARGFNIPFSPFTGIPYEKKHFVLTQMDGRDTKAIYQGEFQLGEFPIRVAYWKDGCLMVPSCFSSKDEAAAYIKDVENNTPATYYMVQERHYVKTDPRIAEAKIIFCLGRALDMYPQPFRKETEERAGEPVVDVWTMFFRNRSLAEQYVDTFNADIKAAKLIPGAKENL